jgi:hypothetical protein
MWSFSCAADESAAHRWSQSASIAASQLTGNDSATRPAATYRTAFSYTTASAKHSDRGPSEYRGRAQRQFAEFNSFS